MGRLRLILKGNGVFSGLSGAALLLGAGVWDAALGLDTWFLGVAGAALVGYGGLLWWLARWQDVVAGVGFAMIMDVVWVVGAAVILLGHPSAMTTTGRVALLAVSVVVAGFADAQFFGLRAAGGRPSRVGPRSLETGR